MQGNILGNSKSSGGLNIQGIIEEYTAQGNITAGGFVEYIDNLSVPTKLSNISYSGYVSSAVKLSETKVFIAHSYNSSNQYLYGMVCTIGENTITVGTDTQLYSTKNYGKVISVTLLDTDKVFVAFANDNATYYLYGIVCTIDGTAITTGTATQLYGNGGSTGYMKPLSLTKLNANKVFLTYSEDYYTLYAMICTINNLSISHGTRTKLNNSTGSGKIKKVVTLNENKVFIGHSLTSQKFYGIVCTIDGTAITTGTDTQFTNSLPDSYSETLSMVALSENKVFITYNDTAVICTIDNMTIIEATPILVYNDNYKSVCIINENTVGIAGAGSVRLTICTINGTIITVEETKEWTSGTGPITFFLLNNNFFIIYSSGYLLHGIILKDGIIPVTTLSQVIAGVAKTSGISGQMVQVYIPNYNN